MRFREVRSRVPKAVAKKMLKLLGTELTQVSGEWYNAPCPMAPYTHMSGKDSSPSFGIHASGAVKCFTCMPQAKQLSGFIFEFHKLAPHFPILQAQNLLQGVEHGVYLDTKEWNAPPPGIEKPWPESSIPDDDMPEDAIDYLMERDVRPEDVGRYDVRWDNHKRNIVWPIRNRLGLLCGAQGRAIDDVEPKYRHHNYPGPGWKNQMVWGNEDLVDLDRPVLVVEGHFDMCSVAHIYENVLVTMTAVPAKEKFPRLERKINFHGKQQMIYPPRIITILDPGTGGDTGRKAWDNWCAMRNIPVTHVLIQGGDPNDLPEEDLRHQLSSIEELLVIQ